MNRFTGTKLLFSTLFLLIFFACSTNSDKKLTDYVNPFIGTGGHGHTYPGAVVPFGLVQLSPDTRLTGWDGCSGYHFSDSIVYGFSHTHLSGTGASDYGDILMMPFSGETLFNNGADSNPGYRSAFDKNSEKASPGFYAVHLTDQDIEVELTATERVGFHKYKFNKARKSLSTDPRRKDIGLQGSVIFDLTHRDQTVEAGLRMSSLTEIEGYRISKAWAQRQPVYFVARFSEPIAYYEIDSFKTQIRPQMFRNPHLKAAIHFDLPENKTLLVKVGISAVDIEGARKNLEVEIEGWDFEAVRQQADEKWTRQLSKIEIETPDEDVKTNFYTALYHNFVVPNIFSDVDGRYLGMDGQVHQDTASDKYTVFSLWDTYRATHPLYTIIEQERTVDFINSMLSHYREGGRLPVWELWGNETNCMIGYHAASVIADASLKGIKGFPEEEALQAMVDFAMKDEFGKTAYAERGFISSEDDHESVSKTLEYAYNDWCIAQMAKSMGNDSVYNKFAARAQNWKNLFDPQTGFFRAKNNNFWFTPFNPFEVNFNYTEANAWQYAFYVPHDVASFIDYHGGEEKLETRMDSLFSVQSDFSGREQPDISGLIGQYAHGNEPSHHIAYLYNYVNKPAKTQSLVHRIQTELYDNAPDGLSGNEDCGQMSAWYIFNALGFYPVTPGNGLYSIGSPLVKAAKIHLENGNTFEVKVHNFSKENYYVQSVKLNGQPVRQCEFSHQAIMDGGVLEFEMGPNPAEDVFEKWMKPEAEEITIVPVPAISAGKKVFFEKDTLELSAAGSAYKIFYTIDDDAEEHLYQNPIILENSAILRAYAVNGTNRSETIESHIFKAKEKKGISLATKYAPQYSAGGDEALVDFITGGTDFRTGEWQGYEGVNLEAIVDLGSSKPIDKVTVHFLQDENAWIFMPLKVEFLVSSNGKDFKLVKSVETKTSPKVTGSVIEAFETEINSSARYVKVVGVNRGKCPEWHKGAGGKSWVFADEIIIN